jgi:hypothetical protein
VQRLDGSYSNADFLKKMKKARIKVESILQKEDFAMKVAVSRKSVDLKVVRVQFPLPPSILNISFFQKKLACGNHFVYFKIKF